MLRWIISRRLAIGIGPREIAVVLSLCGGSEIAPAAIVRSSVSRAAVHCWAVGTAIAAEALRIRTTAGVGAAILHGGTVVDRATVAVKGSPVAILSAVAVCRWTAALYGSTVIGAAIACRLRTATAV